MYQFETTYGSRKVTTTASEPRGAFQSRLYVNDGQTATLLCTTHRTERGARKWARRVLDCSSVGLKNSS